MPAVSRRLLANAVATRLLVVTTAPGYYAKVGRPLTIPAPVGWVAEPPPKSATDQRVQPYFLLFPGTGGDGPDANLGDESTDVTQLLQINAAAGDIEDLLALVDRIHAALNRWTPVVAGHVCGRLRPPPGFDPGPPIPDRQYQPERLYTPMQYQLTATT